MKKFVVILTFAAVLDLLTGCEEEKVVEFGSLQQRGGVYVVPETQKPYSGKFVETEKNIVIKAGSLKNGKLHGELTTYRKDGSIDKVQTFAEDVLNGKSESYYENGKLMAVMHFKDGEPDGKSESYYENGKLVAVMHLKDGELDGKSESYYENGKLMAVMHFKEGKPDGKIEVYSENGQLIAVMQDGKEEVYSESEFKLVEQKLAEATKLFIRRNLNRGKELLDAKKEAR